MQSLRQGLWTYSAFLALTAALTGCGSSSSDDSSSQNPGAGGESTGGGSGLGGSGLGGEGLGGEGGGDVETPDPVCGNGKVESGEACDDGNTDDGDGCQSTCGLPDCGDGVVDAGEVCDDGNTKNGDGCSATCKSNESCGNSVKDPGEACDDGNKVDGDGCQASCALPTCGDGVVDEGELCDDGNTDDGDGCSATCASDESCGNGVVDAKVGEACDDGNQVSGDGCQANCAEPSCGDNVKDADEVCDDGNNDDGDGCSATCDSDETCGNGVLDTITSETCDDGNTASGDGCQATCVLPVCGDGTIDAGEKCDDGNTVSYDGCSATCDSNETCGNGVIDKHTIDSVAVWATGGGDTDKIGAWLKSVGGFTTVDGYDQTNMSLNALLAYDAVLFYTNEDGDPVANGDVLADYAEAGHGVVVATFAWANQGGNTLQGRLITDELSPVLLEGKSLYTNVTIGSSDSSPFFTGVSSIDGYYHDNVSLTAGAVLHGSWSDDEPLVARKGNVVAVNLFPDDEYGEVSGDYRQLFANALKSSLSEECDDGNTASGDGCAATCTVEN